MANQDVLYAAGRPKADAGLMKVLETVGNALAEEKGLPKAGSRVETMETELEVVGCPSYSAGSAYYDTVARTGQLKKGAGMGGLWVNFKSDDNNGDLIKTEVTKREKLSGLAEEVTKSHFFEVKGYVSHTYPLPKNIDLIENEENMTKVKNAIEENGREKTLYSLLNEFMSYRPDPRTTSNAEKVFGLGDDKLYTELKGLLKEEVNEKYNGVDGSKIAALSDSKWKILKFIGSKYRKSKTGEIKDYKAKREGQIDTLRKRFSEPYKFTRANASSFTK